MDKIFLFVADCFKKAKFVYDLAIEKGQTATMICCAFRELDLILKSSVLVSVHSKGSLHF